MKKWALFFSIIILLAIGIAGSFTNLAFQKAWLPWIGKKLEIDLRVEQVDWDPVKGVRLKDLSFVSKQGMTGWIEKVEIQYDLSAFKRGALSLTKVLAENGEFQCKPSFSKTKKTESQNETKVVLRRSSATGLQLESGPVELKNFRVTTFLPTWQGGELAVTNFLNELSVSGYRPGQMSEIKIENEFSGQPILNVDIKQARVKAQFSLLLDADFKFRTGRGQAVVTEVRGKSENWSLDGYEINHQFDLEPYRLKNFLISFSREGKTCGELKASGPVDFNLNTSDIIVTWQGISPDLVNPGLSLYGLQMETGTLSASGQFQILKESVRWQGQAQLEQSQFRRTMNPTGLPVLDGKVAFGMEWFLKQKDLQVDRIEMNLLQGNKPFAEVNLNNPIRLSWNEYNAGEETATLNIKVFPTDVMLFQEAWRGLDKFSLTSGFLEGEGQVIATHSGQKIHWKGQGRMRDLNGRLRQWDMDQAMAEFDTEGDWLNFQKLDLNHLQLTLTEEKKVQAELKIYGKSDAQKGKFTTQIKGNLSDLTSAFSQQLILENGLFEANITTGWEDPEAKQTHFSFVSSDLQGRWGKIQLQNAQIKGEGNFQKAGHEIKFPLVNIKLQTRSNVPEGLIYIKGQNNEGNGSFQFEVGIDGWTQENLKPILEPWGSMAQAETIEGKVIFENQGSVRFLKLNLFGKKILIPSKSSLTFESGTKPSDVKVELIASGNRPRLELSQGLVELESINQSENRALLSGWWESFERFDLKLESQNINLSPIAGLFEKEEGIKNEANSNLKSVVLAPSGRKDEILSQSNLVTKSNFNETNSTNKIAKLNKEKRFKNVDRKLTLNVKKFFLPPYPESQINSTWHQLGRNFSLAPFEVKIGEGILQGEWKGAVAGISPPFELNMTCQNLPLEPFQNLVKPEAKPYFQGLVNGRANLKGMGSQWETLQNTLEGKINLETKETRLELIPAAQSFLRSAAQYVSPELAQTKFDFVSGDFLVGSRKVKTNNLKLQGDLMRLAIQGELDFDQDIDLKVAFTGKKEVLERAQVKFGNFSIGGNTFITFGKTENGYTTLPGLLPVGGKLPDKVEADWEKWLLSIGASSVPTQLQNVINNFLQ